MKSPYKTIIGIPTQKPNFIFVENYHKEKIQRLDRTYQDARNSIRSNGKCIGVWHVKYKGIETPEIIKN